MSWPVTRTAAGGQDPVQGLGRVVLSGGYLFQGGSVNHIVYTTECLDQSVAVTHIANKVTHARIIESLGHLILLQLIPGENDDFRRFVTL